MKNIFFYENKQMEIKPLSDFIKDILSSFGGVKNKATLQKITSDENMKLYEKVFTSPTINPENNYENLEFLGDISVNKSILFNLFEKYPILHHPQGYKIMARLKILYTSKTILQYISSSSLGFLPYIKVLPEVMDSQRHKILTDVFEAFIAATEMIFDKTFEIGVGYAIINEIIKNIFNNINVTLTYENLFDSITRVKELFEFKPFKKSLGGYRYFYEKEPRGIKCTLRIVSGNLAGVIGVGMGHSQGAAQKRAADAGIEFLKARGYQKPLTEPWSLIQ